MRRALTAIIPTYNEELNLAQAIESVLWADEVIIVDSFSTDSTVEIAKSYPKCTVVQHEYEHSAAQKNWIIPQAKHEWILLLDADEWIEADLIKEIQTVLEQDSIEEKGFWMNRLNKFMGKWVHYSGWQNDAVVRLFHREYSVYENKRVHAEVLCEGKIGRLKHKIKHNTYKDFSTYLKKLDTYSNWKAYDKAPKTKSVGFFHLIIKPFFRFFKHYVLKLGFLDGKVGFIIAGLNGYDVFIRAVKIWRIKSGEQFKQNK
ncbi:MAG: glycosyltransferase family 2 protein [Flavobacteriales bacterium]